MGLAMEFAVIDPQARMLRVVRARNLDAAMELIGLQRGGVVHAEVWPGLAIIVDHYSLMRTPSEQYYFAIGNDSDPLSPHRLFAGPAILYEYDFRRPDHRFRPPKSTPNNLD